MDECLEEFLIDGEPQAILARDLMDFVHRLCGWAELCHSWKADKMCVGAARRAA